MSSASLPAPISSVNPDTIKHFLDANFKLPPLGQHGITHPMHGDWCMLPKDFIPIFVHESKAVTLVMLEILFQTIGRSGDGPGERKLWAKLSIRHFARKGLMSRSQAEAGVKEALAKGYILRRSYGNQGFEYRIHFQDIED